jgi:hypothetical protein
MNQGIECKGNKLSPASSESVQPGRLIRTPVDVNRFRVRPFRDWIDQLLQRERLCPDRKASSSPTIKGLLFDVGSDIGNFALRKLAAEGRHRVLAIGHLIDDGRFMVSGVVGQVGLKGI